MAGGATGATIKHIPARNTDNERYNTYKCETQRKPSSLHECLEQSPPRSNSVWRAWMWLAAGSAAALCYLLHSGLSAPLAHQLSTLTSVAEPPHYADKSHPRNASILSSESKTVSVARHSSYIVGEVMQSNTKPKNLPACEVHYKHLKKIMANELNYTLLLQIIDRNVHRGGYYFPKDCRPRHKVAVIVPYRNRERNLGIFLHHMHPFLIKQKLEYRIFVIEQHGDSLFNKGRLFNAGFKEIQKFGEWKCIVFHDVDLLPLDERILYTCPVWPKHMCATVYQKKNNPYFHSLFGGVTSMTPQQYQHANGYSNFYWGWGGEDNDMFWRLRSSGFPVTRCDKTIAEYNELPHTKQENVNRFRFELLRTTRKRYKLEGLSTVSYELISITIHPLYTNILVNVNPYNENINVLPTILEHMLN